jgi:hypothetical protein
MASTAIAINRANSQHFTGPRTEAGKRRSALNALTYGLTCRTAVLPSEAPAAFEQHRRQFLEEYRPATPTETQLVHELADTGWRLNRIPLLEAGLLSPAPSPESPAPAVAALATLGLHTSAKSSSNAASASSAISGTPPPSSCSTNKKESPTIPPRMASFFQKPKSKHSPNAGCASTTPAASNSSSI